MNLESNYIEVLNKQLKNSQHPGMRTYLSALYQLLDKYFQGGQGSALELGSGSGLSQIFLPNHNVVRTDYLATNLPGIMGGVDAQDLPFGDDSFSLVFGVDMLHHVADPLSAISESLRVLNKHGNGDRKCLVFIEPFVSHLSFPVYRVFHTEQAHWKIPIDQLQEVVTQEASDGEQAVSKCIIENWEKLKANNPQLENIKLKVKYLHPFSFFLTGGVNRPFGMPKHVIEFAFKIEQRIPDFLNRYLASRVLMEFEVSK